MRIVSGEVVLSPSDLLRFQGCIHAAALDLRRLRGEDLVRAEGGADAVVVQRRGDEHEARHLAALKETGDVVEIARRPNFMGAAVETLEAMRTGAPVIFQGALATGRFQGWSDFLERVDTPSAFGAWSYEVVDTKLKRRATPAHAVQLSIYSRAVADLQDRAPDSMHVELGDGTRASIAFEGVRHYADRLSARLEAFVAAPNATVPDPVAACGLCSWRDVCGAHWEAQDSLVRVAGITRSQRGKLMAAGIATRGALASREDGVPQLGSEMLGRLKTQAQLQEARSAGGPPSFRLRPAATDRGFALLPEPAPGDLFFDMEGDPFVEGGLEYLFGLVLGEGGLPTFKAWWAHDANGERSAVLAVLDFMVAHLVAHPGAHVYHYNHYEPTALKRLTGAYGVGEAQLDHLLRTKAFVDLYRIVRQAIQTSEDCLSLKDLEVFYRPPREGAVATAVGSVAAYEGWLETGDRTVLDNIAAYNEDDCHSTRGLRDWLVAAVRPAGMAWPILHEAKEEARPIEDPALADLRRRVDAERGRLGDDLPDLLVALAGFHQRAQRPDWWAFFDRPLREFDELLDDMETLVGLEAAGPVLGAERSYVYPAQETKLKVGAKVLALGEAGEIEIVALDRQARRVRLKFPKKLPAPAGCDLVPKGPLDDKKIRATVRRVVEALVSGDGRYRAVADLLERRRPRVLGVADGEPIVRKTDVVQGTVDAVLRLSGCLPIQGPPGTGKTYVASRAILALVEAGKRVAVMSNAHKAIDNLLDAVAERARERGQQVAIAKKIGRGDDVPDDPAIEIVQANEDPRLFSADVVGGTAFLFARPEFDGAFDMLVVDEAGQVALANVVAAGTCARSLVLVGDQAQLAMPVKGVHPGRSGLSCLDYLLADTTTVDPADGIFLPVTRRMHPDVCAVVSRLFYDGRLSGDAGTARQRIDHRLTALGLPPAGVCLDQVRHLGANAQSSEEEANRIREMYEGLLGSIFTNRDGVRREVGIPDILVVAPYNAQVNLLADTLPKGARVGTVDKFQGQEAPICLLSMATSGEDEIPRGLEFLFSPNRLNVAISRAQALSVVICSDRILDVGCGTVEEVLMIGKLGAIENAGKAALLREAGAAR